MLQPDRLTRGVSGRSPVDAPTADSKSASPTPTGTAADTPGAVSGAASGAKGPMGHSPTVLEALVGRVQPERYLLARSIHEGGSNVTIPNFS